MFKTICILLIINLFSNTSLAISAEKAKELTFQGIVDINDNRIVIAANGGYCSTEMFMDNYKIEEYYKKLRFKILDGKEYGKVILWCD